ncbi:MAG: heme-dependent oxidative N-demethylase subunit alpha family protein [Pseudomonadota bacterium]
MHKFGEILHEVLPFRPWEEEATRRLPGVTPLGDAPWLWRDEVFDQQMAYRDHLIATKPKDVIAETTPDVFQELRDAILEGLRADPAYNVSSGTITRPDGVVIPDPSDMAGLARLIQEDILIHERQADEHVLTSGALCFPANWKFSDKRGRGLVAIHDPVPLYDVRIAKGVQRMMDLLRADAPIWRANFVIYNTPELHQPHPHPGQGDFMRVERQILRKLPKTNAVIFTLHTFVFKMSAEMRQSVTPFLH